MLAASSHESKHCLKIGQIVERVISHIGDEIAGQGPRKG
jgi:hypothetical protein